MIKRITLIVLSITTLSCSKEIEPDWATPNVGTYEEVREEIINEGDYYRLEAKNTVNITKASNSSLRLNIFSESFYYNRSGHLIDSDNQTVILTNCRLLDDRSFMIDEKVFFGGDNINASGTGVRTGNKLIITLSIKESDGEEYGGVINLTRK